MGERMWPKFRLLTITLTFLSSAARRRRMATVRSRRGVVDEDVLVAVLAERVEELP